MINSSTYTTGWLPSNETYWGKVTVCCVQWTAMDPCEYEARSVNLSRDYIE